MSKQVILSILTFIIPFMLGAFAGHYHGKSSVYEKVYKTADHMMINPITMKNLNE